MTTAHMRRGLCILGALAGWLTIANATQSNANPQDNTAAEVERGATRIAESIREIRPGDDAGCADRSDNRSSDLCAQWKAADAARDAATASIIAAILSAFGTVLVAATLGYSIKTSRRELRAYVSVTPKGVYARDDDGFTRIPMLVKNDGQTPAVRATIESYFTFTESPIDFDPRTSQHDKRDFTSVDCEAMWAPRCADYVYTTMSVNPTPQTLLAMSRNEMALVHWGVVRYRDVFDTVRYTYFAHYHWGEELTDANSKRCRLGNNVT